jgi:dihydroorotate dehydrogenase
MLSTVLDLARPLLFALDPERAHELALKSLEIGIFRRLREKDDPRLSVNLWGMHFPNPLSTAAGFDKDARVADSVFDLGFGFAEVGSVTPYAQFGNPKPRVFRLTSDRAVINRLGFNNAGHAAALYRLKTGARRGIVGVNVGANNDSQDRMGDFVSGVRAFYDVASYFTVNISSPNTPGLRELQAPAALDRLLGQILAARAELMAAGKPRRPIVVKISPDIVENDLPAVIDRLSAHAIDAIAISNTTLARNRLQDTETARETGGLSGRPLFWRSTVILGRVFVQTQGRVPLIGIGGIDSGAAALAKLEAGATLLQLYTGLIYEGPSLITRIKRCLVNYCEHQQIQNIRQVTGVRAEEWANRSVDG